LSIRGRLIDAEQALVFPEAALLCPILLQADAHFRKRTFVERKVASDAGDLLLTPSGQH
jgi:hypothetical protein